MSKTKLSLLQAEWPMWNSLPVHYKETSTSSEQDLVHLLYVFIYCQYICGAPVQIAKVLYYLYVTYFTYSIKETAPPPFHRPSPHL